MELPNFLVLVSGRQEGSVGHQRGEKHSHTSWMASWKGFLKKRKNKKTKDCRLQSVPGEFVLEKMFGPTLFRSSGSHGHVLHVHSSCLASWALSIRICKCPSPTLGGWDFSSIPNWSTFSHTNLVIFDSQLLIIFVKYYRYFMDWVALCRTNLDPEPTYMPWFP